MNPITIKSEKTMQQCLEEDPWCQRTEAVDD